MDYFLKANGLIILLWLFYYALLRNETFFLSIRVYFLMGLIIILSIPLIEIPINVEKAVSNIDFTVMDVASTNYNHIEQAFDWSQLLITLYFIGVAFFIFKFIIQLYSIKKLFSKQKIIRQGKYKLVETSKNISPFSFFNFIIYNPSSFTFNELDQIIYHEKTHANQWHSIDNLLTSILQIFFWFNPFAWVYKKAVEQNLEFLADNYVFESPKWQQSYQKLIVKTSVPDYQMALTNNFYNSFLKKRILMLHTRKSNRKSQWKFALILPLLLAFIFAFNTKTIAQQEKEEHKTIVKTVEIHAMILTKNSNSEELDKISKSFAEKGLKVEFKGIKRNKDSEITAIKIDAKANNGKTSAAYATDDNEGINAIKIEFDNKNNSLSIGASGGEQTNAYVFSKKGKKKIIKQKGKGKSYVFISDDEDNEEQTTTKVWVTKDGDTTKVETKKIIIEIEEDQSSEQEEIYEVVIDEDEEKTESKSEWKVSYGSNNNAATNTDTAKKNADQKSDGLNKWKVTSGRNNVAFVTSDTLYLYEKKNSELFPGMIDFTEKPLYMIDGNESTKEAFESLNSQEIRSISIIKDSGKLAFGDKGKNGVIMVTTNNSNQKKYQVSLSDSALYIINGKESSKEASEKLNPDNIESINVFKGKKAEEKYGDKGKNGVVEITLKKE